MFKSVWSVNEQARDKYKTRMNTYQTFPEGTPVMIICAGQDHFFFYNETGRVTESKNKYLGITVEFDKPRHFEDGTIQRGFSFDPDDLVRIQDVTAYCRGCVYDSPMSNKHPGYDAGPGRVFGLRYCGMGILKINKHRCKHRKLMKDKRTVK